MAREKKSVMKMKRVDDLSKDSIVEVPNSRLAETNTKVVGGINGITTVMDKGYDEETNIVNSPIIDSRDQKIVTGASVDQGVVTLTAPKDEEMEEVKFEDLDSTVDVVGVSARDQLDDLIGKDVDFAKDFLSKMKEGSKIAEFRLIPIGLVATGDYVSGRVDVLYDAIKKIVISVSVG